MAQSTASRARRNGKPAELSQSRTVALYLRVSTAEQADRQTIDQQRDRLRAYCRAMDDGEAGTFDYAGAREYADDGISGTLALVDRPAGQALLDDCRAGRIGLVVFARIDRFARSLRELMNAQEELEGLGVGIASVSEQFDTTNANGKLIFHILGAMAEFDRANTVERLTGGRRAVTRAGAFVGGVIPFGYEVDTQSQLVPSRRRLEALGMTEAEAVADMFRRMADEGATTVSEAQRLNAHGVVPCRRYVVSMKPKRPGATPSRSEIPTPSGQWRPNRISLILKNPLYKGEPEIDWSTGAETLSAPPLVAPDVWARANAALARNMSECTRPDSHVYLMRGLITCSCGYKYVGNPKRGGDGSLMYYYRCGRQVQRTGTRPEERCRSRMINADRIEAAVWADIKDFVADPGQPLETARGQLAGRLARAASAEQERGQLLSRLAEKDRERERALLLFRRGTTSVVEMDQALGEITRESTTLRAQLDALSSEVDVARAWEARVSSAASLLSSLGARVAAIEADDDAEARRALVAQLVAEATATEAPGTGKRPRIEIDVTYVFGERRAVNISTGTGSDSDSTSLAPIPLRVCYGGESGTAA
jgi:site-specific DNA recombinase